MESRVLLNDEVCEKYVLSVLLTDANAFSDCTEIINADVFYYPKHQTIYRAIAGVVAEGDTPDILNVSAYVMQHPESDSPVEVAYIAEVSSVAATSVNFMSHCARLAYLHQGRQMWLVGQKLIRAGVTETEDIDAIKSEALESLHSIGETPQTSIITANDAMHSLQAIVNDNLSGNRRNGIPTGFCFLDQKGGFQLGDFVVIGAEFSQGKTSLALDICVHAAKNGYPAAFYSTEMQSHQLAARMIAADSGLSSRIIMQNPLTTEQLQTYDAAVGRMANLPIYFDDTSTLSVERIIASIRTMTRKRGVKIAFIDYLQVLQTNERISGRTEEQFFGEATRRFQRLAKELRICIVLLSQLSRSKDTTEPNLSRMRGSGQINEAADIELLIYRPEFYGKKYSGEHSNIDPKGTALIKLAKGRNIGTGDFICGYNAPTTHFYDLETIPMLNSGCQRQSIADDGPF